MTFLRAQYSHAYSCKKLPVRMKLVTDQGAALRSLTKSFIRITFAHRKGDGGETVIHYLISLTFVNPPPHINNI